MPMSMKKTILLSALTLGLFIPSAFSQKTLLNEGFEGGQAKDYTRSLPDGWTRVDGVNNPTEIYYNWVVGYNEGGNTMTGQRFLYVDAPTYDNGSKDLGPRTERVLTPELNLDDTYRLSFNWKAAYHSAIELKEYDLHVYVIDMADNSEHRIFTFSNEKELRDSGVPADMYTPTKLWTNWGLQTSSFDLSQFQGKKVKIAFDYQLYKKSANSLWIDEVKVYQAPAETAPIAQISDTQYDFGTLYIGEKMYSTPLTIKNVGKSGLKITGVEAPDNIGVAYNPNMELSKNEEGQIQLWYKTALTTPAQATVKVKTNGGDLEIAVKAAKTEVPEGYQLELFEGTVPPPGWSTEGMSNFSATAFALEGDQSVISHGYIEDTYFISPRLDFSVAGAPTRLTFTYFNDAQTIEAGTFAGNDIFVESSADGGATWTTEWTLDPALDDAINTINIDLSKYAGKNDVRVRWKNAAVYYDSEYGMDPATVFYLDRVLLPSVYGMKSIPLAQLDPIAPAKDAQNVLPRSVKLQWAEAQFAEGYKVYLGTSSSNWNILNGSDLGNVTTTTVTDLAYATEYSWKVVPYNQYGEAENCMVWHFTTQPDCTISQIPYVQDFEGDVFPPLGWECENVGHSKWSINNTNAFDGKASVSVNARAVGDVVSLITPSIKLPANDDVTLSFWWGNNMCVSLIKDVNAVHTNPTKGSNNEDEVYLDIYADGDWKQLLMLSDPNDEDHRYWIHEQVDLSDYAGKTIALRWRYKLINYNRADGASLDNVELRSSSELAVAFSQLEWNAFKVNYEKVKTSPVMALTNFGTTPLTVAEVAFDKENFSTSLAPGTKIEPNTAANFRIDFNAMKTCALPTDSVKVESAMIVKFEGGSQVSLPVRALALGERISFWDFENDKTGQAPEGFTIFDDGKPTNPITFWTYPNKGNQLSFFVLNEDECYSQMDCPIGKQALMSVGSAADATADDWLVSMPLFVGNDAKVKFDARSWETVNSILPGNCSTVSVWVSENGPENKNDFVQLGENHKLSLYDLNDWEHLEFDLSPYKGKQVHVALRNVISDGLGSFFDNLEFADCSADESGVQDIMLQGAQNVKVYTIDGTLVAASAEAYSKLPAGIYIIKTADKTQKVLKR